MARPTIIERTNNEVLVERAELYFKKVYKEVQSPVTYSGKHAILAVIVTNISPSEAQMNALETAIEGLTGIHKAHVMIGPARIPLDRVPAGNDLFIGVEAGFDIRATPVK